MVALGDVVRGQTSPGGGCSAGGEYRDASICSMQKLVVAGQGYVGLPLAMRAVDAGYDVVGYDVDEYRVKRLEAGESYVDDISDEVLAAALASGHYCASTESKACAGFDVAVITVPTPLRDGN